MNAGGRNFMKDWKNISNETWWIWRTINIIIQITRLIGKESNSTVLQYILVNLILPGFFRTKTLMGGKNDPPSCYLENGSLHIHATWQNIFYLWTFLTFGGVAMILMLYIHQIYHIYIWNLFWNMKYETYLKLCHHKIWL